MSSTVMRPFPSGSGMLGIVEAQRGADALRVEVLESAQLLHRAGAGQVLAALAHRLGQRLQTDIGDVGIAVDRRDLLGIGKLLRDRGKQVLGLRMPVQRLLFEAPGPREAAVPQLEMPIGRKHGERFEQIVESGGPRAQKGVASGGKRELLGPILRDQDQSAIGHGLGENAQMSGIGKRPVFLMRFVGQEPARHFLAPGGKIANLGNAPVLARHHQHLFEAGPVVHDPRRQAENTVEGLICEGHPPVRIELRDADGQLVEHGALGFAEGAEFAGLLLHFFDIYGVSRDPVADQRQIGNAQGPALSIDRRSHHALDRLTPLARLLRDLASADAVDLFDQLDLFLDHRVRTVGTDRGDVGAIDEPQLHVGAAKPHRHRCRLDQSDQSAEVLARAGRLFAQAGQFLFAVAEIEHPDQRRPGRRDARIRERTPQGQSLARIGRDKGHGEGRRALLGAADMLGERFELRIVQPAFGLPAQLAQIFGHPVEAEPSRQAVRRFDPSIRAHQQGDGGRFLDHARQPPDGTAGQFGAPRARARLQHEPARHRRPRGEQQADHDQKSG